MTNELEVIEKGIKSQCQGSGQCGDTPKPECPRCNALAALVTVRERMAAVGDQIEFDRTAVADGITRANKAIDSRHWLTESRGSFEWNDDKWHDEFRAAALEIRESIAPLAKIAANWKDCPQKAEDVATARIDLQAQIAALTQERNEARKQLSAALRDLGLTCDSLKSSRSGAEVSQSRVTQLEGALREVRLRMIFVGWPAELMWKPHGKAVPDWRKEFALIAGVLGEQNAPLVCWRCECGDIGPLPNGPCPKCGSGTAREKVWEVAALCAPADPASSIDWAQQRGYRNLDNAATQPEAPLSPGDTMRRVRDERIAQIRASLKGLQSAMDQQYSMGCESLFKTWSTWVATAICALAIPGDPDPQSSGPLSPGERGLAAVGGEHMDRSIADHERACLVLISFEQEKLMPDNSVVAALCDSVRMGREYARWMRGASARLSASPEPAAKEPMATPPFRLDLDGELDEFSVTDAKIHVERMSDLCFWIGITAGGRDFAINTGVEDGKWFFRIDEDRIGTDNSHAVERVLDPEPAVKDCLPGGEPSAEEMLAWFAANCDGTVRGTDIPKWTIEGADEDADLLSTLRAAMKERG